MVFLFEGCCCGEGVFYYFRFITSPISVVEMMGHLLFSLRSLSFIFCLMDV